MVRIEFTRRFSMAHRLLADPASKCATPHGHNEIVRVELRARSRPDLGGSNMVAPFERLKSRWHHFIDHSVDHALQLRLDDPLVEFFARHEPQRLSRIMTFAGDPTTEALALALHAKLSAFLREDAPGFVVERVSVEETPTNAVSVHRADIEAMDIAWQAGAWVDRADDTINDFGVSTLNLRRRG